MPIIGIDLGTTNSLAAVWREGRAVLIPNAAGSCLTPSAVSIDEDGTVLVGQAARDRLVSCPDRSAASFKRWMGKSRQFHLADRTFTPEELSALVLRRLKEDAEAFLGEPVTEAVISVPAYFAEAQRAATKRAGALAGLRVERLINEPSAAALASRLGHEEDETLLVFDFGGGTLDISIVECFDNVISVIAVSGDDRLGGDDFDLAIAQGFCRENGLDWESVDKSAQAILLRQAEQCKRGLSQAAAVHMSVAGEHLSGSMTLTAPKLLELCAGPFSRLRAPVSRAVGDCGLPLSEISAVVPVGGSCRMPLVQQYLTELLHRPLRDSAGTDTAVALGAAIYAAIKERREELREVVLTDICPFTLGTNIIDWAAPNGRELLSPIISRNSVLPSSKQRRYVTTADGQAKMIFRIYQGEQLYAVDNTLLGQLELPIPRAPKGREGADVRFTYDINGLLEVEATVISTGERHQLLIGRPGGMDEREAQRRLRELSALKLHPRDQEENRALTARIERLFAECAPDLRPFIQQAASRFTAALESQESWKIVRERKEVSAFLDQIDTDPLDRFRDM